MRPTTYPALKLGTQQAMVQRMTPLQYSARVLLEIELLELLLIRGQLGIKIIHLDTPLS